MRWLWLVAFGLSCFFAGLLVARGWQGQENFYDCMLRNMQNQPDGMMKIVGAKCTNQPIPAKYQ